MAMIRGIIFFSYMFTITIVLGAVLWPFLFGGVRGARVSAKIWCHALLFGLRWLTGIRTNIEGRENIPQGAALIAANHQSMWETLFLFHLLPAPVFVLKQELIQVPIIGSWLRSTGAIEIDRSAGIRAIRKLNDDAAERIRQGAQVVIFPEGTRRPVGSETSLQSGVAAIYKSAGAPCTPAAHDSGRHWIHPGPAKSSGVITIRFLPAIPTGLDKRSFLSKLDIAITNARPDLSHSTSKQAAGKQAAGKPAANAQSAPIQAQGTRGNAITSTDTTHERVAQAPETKMGTTS